MELGHGVGGGDPPTAPPDYYQLLQVDPDAPRELIVEAYWYLAGRLHASRHDTPGLRERLEALNEAYAKLVSPEQRSAYDATLPRVRKLRQERSRALEAARRRSWVSILARGRPSRRRPGRFDYYAALYVDPSAEPAIVSKAHSVLRLLHSNGVARARGLALSTVELEQAHAVLADPARRAAYDASRASPAEINALRRAVPPAPTTAVALPSPSLEATASTSGAAAPAEAASSVASPAATQETPPAGEQPEGAGEGAQLAEAVRPTKLSGLARRASATVGALLASALRASSRRPSEVPGELVARRLRRELPPPPVEDAERRPAEELLPLARLILMYASGRKQILELGPEPITLGTGPACDVRLEDEGGAVAAQHARIWYGGGRFILQALAGHRTTLAGGKPVVWAALEHGDEIAIGSSRMRFEILQPQPVVPDHLRAPRPD